MKLYRRFNLIFFPATLVSLLGVGLVNYAIDPFDVMNGPNIDGFNHLKPEQFSYVRLFKAIAVTRIRPKTVLLGSSRVDLGLDPQHPALSAAQPSYNLALVGPNMYEVRRYFEHALENQPDIEQVVLGIDFFMFNERKENSPDFDEGRLNRRTIGIKDSIRSTLSFNAVKSSVETIESSISSNAYFLYNEQGMRYVYDDVDLSMQDKFDQMTAQLLDGVYEDFQLSPDYLSDLQAIVDLCREHNIDLKVFISPIHATLLDAVKEAGFWSEYETWKREVVQITPVWDFSGYNSITTEPIRDDMRHYWDSSHYRKEVGDLILNRLFQHQNHTVPPDFGALVTAQTIESHIVRGRVERSLWRQAHRHRHHLARSPQS